jgi:acetolactate synthase-1/2/3 large subunit
MSMQRNYFSGRYVGSEPTSGLTLPDLVKIGDAYGFTTFKIMTNLKSVSTIKEALAAPGPVLVEVVTDPMQQQQPRVASRILPDGSIQSAPMEDLFPFLPRDEFDAEMRLTI